MLNVLQRLPSILGVPPGPTVRGNGTPFSASKNSSNLIPGHLLLLSHTEGTYWRHFGLKFYAVVADLNHRISFAPAYHLEVLELAFRSSDDKRLMSSTERPEAGFVAGQRVQSVNTDKKSPQVGTVKYVGPVDGYEGLWIGVDWDSGQGRHNGTVNGRHYFDASEETSGSLVRQHTLSSGVTLLEALVRRYNSSLSRNDSQEEGNSLIIVRCYTYLSAKAKIIERH